MRYRLLSLLVLLPAIGRAQGSAAADHPRGATVTGVVGDSIARRPLAGARVQLVSAANTDFVRSTESDARGRYSFDAIPEGRYHVGFFHAVLDSLGVQAPARVVQVTGTGTVRVDLAVPGPARLRTAICGAQATADSSISPPGVLVGTVRDAHTHAPVDSASVTGEWVELSLGSDGMMRHVPRFTAHTGDNGWFAICGVPSGGTMFVSAAHGADSTAVVEVEVPPEGFARRDLYVGAARTVVLGDTTRMNDTLAPPVRRLRVGDARLSGVVVASAGSQPLAGARVAIADGPETRANDRGEWTIGNAPPGTRMLEVRAVGYFPRREAVDVVDGAPGIRTTLSTFKAMLDTIRVVARRPVFNRDTHGFAQRKRMGHGRFITADDIVRRDPIHIVDMLMNFPGIRVDRYSMGGSVLMRGPFGMCAPSIFVDGMNFSSMSPDDLDAFVNPQHVTGIEVYTDLTGPPQFKDFTRMDSCGSIVIWTS